jgi:DNA-directed RNA polymerase specialized sigma24 family protein
VKSPDRALRASRTASVPSPREPELTRLVRRIADRDRSAFCELFDALSGRLFAAMRSRLRDEQRAGDITAATFVEVWWMARHHRAAGDDPAVWIVDIAARRAADRMRAGAVHPGDPDCAAGAVVVSRVHDIGTNMMLASLLGRPPVQYISPRGGG